MVAVAPSSSGIVGVMPASCAPPSGTLESGASVFVGGESGSDDFLLDGVDDSRRNKPMSTTTGGERACFLAVDSEASRGALTEGEFHPCYRYCV